MQRREINKNAFIFTIQRNDIETTKMKRIYQYCLWHHRAVSGGEKWHGRAHQNEKAEAQLIEAKAGLRILLRGDGLVKQTHRV